MIMNEEYFVQLLTIICNILLPLPVLFPTERNSRKKNMSASGKRCVALRSVCFSFYI